MSHTLETTQCINSLLTDRHADLRWSHACSDTILPLVYIYFSSCTLIHWHESSSYTITSIICEISDSSHASPQYDPSYPFVSTFLQLHNFLCRYNLGIPRTAPYSPLCGPKTFCTALHSSLYKLRALKAAATSELFTPCSASTSLNLKAPRIAITPGLFESLHIYLFTVSEPFRLLRTPLHTRTHVHKSALSVITIMRYVYANMRPALIHLRSLSSLPALTHKHSTLYHG